MKRLLVFFTALLMFATTMSAGGKLTVRDITGSKFSAKMVQGMNPIAGTDTYARILAESDRFQAHRFMLVLRAKRL